MTLARAARRPIAPAAVLIVLATALLALFLGLASAVLPWQWMVMAAGLLIGVPVLIWRPQWLVVPLIALQMYLPSQPMADLATGLFFVRCALGLIGPAGSQIGSVLKDPLLRPVYIVLLIAITSLAAGATFLGHDKKLIYGDARVFFYWLWLPALWLVAAPGDRVQWLVKQLLALALLVSLLTVFQGVTGISLVSTGRVGQLETLGRVDADITRVQIAGFVFVTFGIFYCVARVLSHETRRKWLFGLFLLVMLVALLYNFGRALWAWSVIGSFLVAVLLGWRATLKACALAFAVGAVSLTMLATFQPRLLDTVVQRAASAFNEGGSSTSLGWRKFENRFALKKLEESAFLGVGFGGEYRNPEPGLRLFPNHTSYIHHGHLSLMLKVSVFGYLAYVALFAFLVRRAMSLRHSPGCAPISAATIAWALTFAGQNITQPDIMSAHGVTLAAALVLVFACLRQKPRAVSKPSTEQQTARIHRGQFTVPRSTP